MSESSVATATQLTSRLQHASNAQLDSRVAHFFSELMAELESHPVLCHPFLMRFAEGRLTMPQIAAYAIQHYYYSRNFGLNLAAVVSNVPNEKIRAILVHNLYEESGNLNPRDRTLTILLQHELVTGDDVAWAYQQMAQSSRDAAEAEIVEILIEQGKVTRSQVAQVMGEHLDAAAEFTHPALFRRFLRAVGVTPEVFERSAPIPETTLFTAFRENVCRHHDWREAMGAMGPGTECVVPRLYRPIECGLRNSGLVSPSDYVFWTIHVHGDERHGNDMIDALIRYGDDGAALVARGARQALDTRKIWLDGVERHVFG